MPRSILSQREQWPDRYADNNLFIAPDTDAVVNPAEIQNDDAFSDADRVPAPKHRPSVEEDAAIVNYLQQKSQGGSSSGAPGGGADGGAGAAGGGGGGGGSSASGGAGAAGGTAVATGGGVPLIRNPDGTYTSSDPEWAKLIHRESGGDPTIVNKDPTDPNAGPNASQGLFQFTPETWHSLGFSGMPKDAPAEVQAQAAAKLLQKNPSGSDWGAGRSGRENAELLMKGLSSSSPSASSTTSPTAAGTGAANLGAPAAPPGQLRNVSPAHGQGPIDGPDVHGQLPPDMVNFQTALQKQFPNIKPSDIGTYRPPDPGGFDEHSSGHGMDVMIKDPAMQKQVRDWALQQPNVNFVLNQQTQWNPNGTSEGMDNRGNPTQNHMDHDHINVAGEYQYDPSVTPPTTTPSTTTPSTATTPATQPTQPTQPTTDPTTPTPATQPAVQQPPPTQQPPPMTLAQRRFKRASTFMGR